MEEPCIFFVTWNEMGHRNDESQRNEKFNNTKDRTHGNISHTNTRRRLSMKTCILSTEFQHTPSKRF